MLWISTDKDGGCKGTRASLLTYRHTAANSGGAGAVPPSATEPIEVVKRLVVDAVSAIWEDVSSWAETCSSVSCSPEIDATCATEVNSFTDPIQARMERIHQLNSLRRFPFGSCGSGDAAVVPECRAPKCDVGVNTSVRVSRPISPVGSSLSEVFAWPYSTQCSAEDILLFEGTAAAAVEAVGVLGMRDTSIGNGNASGSHKWCVKRLTSAELSELLGFGGEEVMAS